MRAVISSTLRVSLRMPPRGVTPWASRSRMRSRRLARRPINSSRMVELVMKPSPPTWISSRMIAWPNGLQKVLVSTTTRPVTQTAEVAVKRAVM